MPDLKGKKAVMIIAHENYRNEEFDIPKQVLESAGVEISVASSSMKDAKGTLGGTTKPDMLVNDINVGDFDAVIFVGGTGSSEYWDDPKALQTAAEAFKSGRVIAAICIAPVTLANAGVLKGKKATVYPSEEARLKQKGAVYTGKSVQEDGNIITANGPKAAEDFGKAIAICLQSK